MNKKAENLLSNYFDKKNATLTGKGATALWSIYKTLDKPKVIVQANLCLSPVFTLLYADKEPVFCDIMSNGNIDPELVEKILAERDDVAAILAVHTYGIVCDIDKLKEISIKNNVLLIEDNCQALGGRYSDGSLLGTKGDISVISFGHSKILELGGGGAILTDNDNLIDEVNYHLSTVKEVKNLTNLQQKYSNLFYSIFNEGSIDRKILKSFHAFPDMFKDLYFKEVDKDLPNKVIESISKLEKIVSNRRDVATKYAEKLKDINGIKIFYDDRTGVPWRFTFSINSQIRDKMILHLRKNLFDVSSWYPSIVDWFKVSEGTSTNFPESLKLEKEVINLWVTPEYQGEKSDLLIEEIIKFDKGLRKHE
jgi:dTDP-4-amino-4,6-dideoxygalactose transaminase